MRPYTIEIAGNDITEWVIAKPDITLRKNNVGELAEIPNAEFIVENSGNLFTPLHPQSIFQDNRQDRTVKIYEDETLLYDGFVRKPVPDLGNIQASIGCTAKINRLIGSYLLPLKQPQQTLAELSAYIYFQYGIDTDPISYSRATEKQSQISLFGRLFHSIFAHGSSLMEIQQYLANAGMCRHYFLGNTAYMDFYDPFETRYSMYTFNDDHIINIDSYQPIEVQVYNGFHVTTELGVASEAGLYQVPALNGDVTNPIVLTNLGGAYNWGNRQIALSERDRYEISLTLAKTDQTEWLGMNSVFTIDSDHTGVSGTFEVLSIDKNSEVTTTVIGESI